MNFEQKKIFLVNITVIAVWCALIYLIIKFMLAYLLPFIIGISLAFIMQKPAKLIAKNSKLSRGTCAAVLVAVAYIAVISAVGFFVWLIWSFSGKAIDILPDFIEFIAKAIEGWRSSPRGVLADLPQNTAIAIDKFLDNSFNTFTSGITSFFSSLAGAAAKNLPAFLISSLVTVAASIYFAKDFEQLMRFIKNLVGNKIYGNIIVIKQIVTESVLKFTVGYLLIMFITFCELWSGFLILGVKNALLIAVAVALVDVLPVLGTGTVLLPWAAVSFLGGNHATGIGLIIIYIVITVARNFLEPRIIGRQIGVAPLLTLITMFVGLKVAGIAGMVILPITVIVVIDFYRLQLKKERE